MRVGDAATVSRSFSAGDVDRYLSIGGAATTAGTVPEPLIAGLWSYLLGVRLPGLGTMYLKQETNYRQPAAVGTALTARVRITRTRPEKHLVDLETTCHSADGALIAEGRALVYVRDVAGPRLEPGLTPGLTPDPSPR